MRKRCLRCVVISWGGSDGGQVRIAMFLCNIFHHHVGNKDGVI